MVHWKSRDINSLLKGYKMDLAATVGYKLPSSLLNFFFKHTYLRKVSRQLAITSKEQSYVALSREKS